MQAALYEDEKYGKVYKRRETKSTIYFPKNVDVLDANGDVYYRSKFWPDFANGVFYQMGINTNHTSKRMKIKIKIH